MCKLPDVGNFERMPKRSPIVGVQSIKKRGIFHRIHYSINVGEEMMARFTLFMLAFFVSIVCNYGNAIVQISEFKCRVPDNSMTSIDHSMNVHVNPSEEEFELLQIEGRCFLFCATEIYSNEIRMLRNFSVSSFWPFIAVNQTDCKTTLKIHECTRGCLYRNRSKVNLRKCNEDCQKTCQSVMDLQNCAPFQCDSHPWIHSMKCNGTMCETNFLNRSHPCFIGCKQENLQQQSSAPRSLRDPIDLPLLIQDLSKSGQFKFIVDLSGAAPQPEKCEPISTFTDAPSVAFLFKFVDINSGNVSYKWTASPFEQLDLIDYACQELQVSFAVSNKEGLSMFSPSISMTINGDERLAPIPPNNLVISEDIDERVGSFGHVILNISWDAPQNSSYLDYFSVIITTAAGFNTTLCGCGPWSRRVQSAKSVESLPVMSMTCSYDVQVHSIGCFGASYPLRKTYDISTEFPGLLEDVSIMSCSRNNSNITLYLEWSSPSVIIRELGSYDVCVGVTLLPDQEIPDPDNGSQECSLNLNGGQTQTVINYPFVADSNHSESLYIQIRAHTRYTTGNWSELHYDISACDHGVANSYYSVGVIVGISMSSFLALIFLFLPIGLAMWFILQRKKPHRIVQGSHDPIFSGGTRNLHLQRLLTSPRMLDKWEIPSSEIIVKELLGAGTFGDVYRGIIKCPIASPKMWSSMKKSIFTSVAIKQLKPLSRGNERQNFLSEIEMMKKVAEDQNPHVVRLLGCVTIKEPLMLIIEFVKYGDLLSYLRTNQRMCTGSNTEKDDRDEAYLHLGNVSPVDLISFAYQITSGMEYLSSLGIVHRDLACRNILVDEGKVLKITDFGLSRETDEIYVQKSTGRVPLKWMAIESIIAKEFTSASDVWSFGITLWEIGTLGGFPYPSIQNENLLSMLKGGYRMEKPDNCSPEVYDIMLICWKEQPKQRPTFKELRARFDAMLLAEKKDTYIALCFDESKSYYHSLIPVTTKDGTSDSCTSDKNLPTRKKLASAKQSSVSLDEAHIEGKSNHENRARSPDRLSLQLLNFTHSKKGHFQNRYVPSPVLTPTLQESETRFEN